MWLVAETSAGFYLEYYERGKPGEDFQSEFKLSLKTDATIDQVKALALALNQMRVRP